MKSQKMKAMKTLYILILFSAVLVKCGSTTEQTTEDHHDEQANLVEISQDQLDQATIAYGAIEKRTMGIPLNVNGQIDVPPQGNISINMPYGGFITKLQMLPGTEVRKGQSLVTLENPDFINFQQEYLEALANRLYLKEEFDRQEKLYQEQVSSKKDFEKAKSDHFINEATIQSLEAKLYRIGFNTKAIHDGKIRSTVTITSPVNGAVRDVFSNVGSFVQPQDVIMSITNREDLHVELTVYENDIPKVKMGQRIRFRTENTEEWREAKVFLVGKNVRENRSVTVHGHLSNHDDDLLPGMYVSAEIETDKVNVWAVEEQAIVRFAGKQFVFAFKATQEENGETVHVFEMIEVNTGTKSDNFVEINAADSSIDLANLKLVSKGAFTLLAAAKNMDEEGGHGH